MIRTLMTRLAALLLDAFALEGTEYTDEAEVLAEDLVEHTSLNPRQAVVVAGDMKGLSDMAIERRLVYSGESLENVRAQLRQEYRTVYEKQRVRDATEQTVKEWAKVQA